MKRFFRFVKWGACNHPGNSFYVILFFGFGVACSRNATTNPLLGFLVGLGIGLVLLFPLYICTSYSVGKANARLIDEEEKQAST